MLLAADASQHHSKLCLVASKPTLPAPDRLQTAALSALDACDVMYAWMYAFALPTSSGGTIAVA